MNTPTPGAPGGPASENLTKALNAGKTFLQGLFNTLLSIKGSWLALYAVALLLLVVSAADGTSALFGRNLPILLLGTALALVGYFVMRQQGVTPGMLLGFVRPLLSRLSVAGKFTLLKLYRILLLLSVVAVLYSGANTAYRYAQNEVYVNGSYQDVMDWNAYFVYLLPSVLLAVGLGIAAEIIQLFLNIEDHLMHIRDNTRAALPAVPSAAPTSAPASIPVSAPAAGGAPGGA